MSQTARKTATKSPQLKEAEVIAWLAKRPQFFSKHSDKLAHLSLPKKGGNILSLHAAKAEKVEKSAQKIALTHQRLLLRAEENSTIASQLFATVLALIDCTTLASLRKTLQTVALDNLELDAIRLIPAGAASGASTLTTDDITAMCSGGTVTLRTLSDASQREMYGPKGKLIKSDCLLKLSHRGTVVGLLAMGSTNPARFHAGQSTEMATFLANVVATCLSRSN